MKILSGAGVVLQTALVEHNLANLCVELDSDNLIVSDLKSDEVLKWNGSIFNQAIAEISAIVLRYSERVILKKFTVTTHANLVKRKRWQFWKPKYYYDLGKCGKDFATEKYANKFIRDTFIAAGEVNLLTSCCRYTSQ